MCSGSVGGAAGRERPHQSAAQREAVFQRRLLIRAGTSRTRAEHWGAASRWRQGRLGMLDCLLARWALARPEVAEVVGCMWSPAGLFELHLVFHFIQQGSEPLRLREPWSCSKPQCVTRTCWWKRRHLEKPPIWLQGAFHTDQWGDEINPVALFTMKVFPWKRVKIIIHNPAANLGADLPYFRHFSTCSCFNYDI